MKIIEDKKNELLKRRQVKVIVEAGKNPSIKEASKIIADEFKANEECVAIKSVKGKFGRNTFLIIANIYNNKEDKLKIEPKSKGKKGEKKAIETPEEKPAEKEKLSEEGVKK